MDLAEIADRLLITETLHAYCERVDRGDHAGVLALFTDDAVVDMGRGVVSHSREELRALLTERTGRWTSTSHHGSTAVVLRYDGATAATTSHLYVLNDAPDRDETLHLWARYTDELVKQDGAWRFRTRRFRVAAARRTTSSPIPDRFEPPARV